MTRYVLRRAVLTLPTLLGISILVFLLVQLAPGDPARAIAGPFATAETLESIRQEYDLDDPLPVQYARWLADAAQGDLGRSPNLSQPIAPLIVSKFLNTAVLVGSALMLAFVGGVLIGVLAGRRQHSRTAKALMALNVATANVPPYLLGMILVLVFASTLHWFPSGGMYDLRAPGGLPDLASHLVLPALTVAAAPIIIIARMTRASVIEVSQQDYVLVARAVGITPRRVTWQYIVWNALPPVIAVSGLQVGALLSGALFAEIVFSWPGLGDLLYTAVLAKDVLTIQAVTLFVALTFLVSNLIADLLIGFISPRSRAFA